MSRAEAKARERALERAGFSHVSGWLREPEAQQVRQIIESQRPCVEAITKGETK